MAAAQVFWSLGRSKLLQRELPALNSNVQLAVRDRLEEFSGLELAMMARDFFNLRLYDSGCAAVLVGLRAYA